MTPRDVLTLSALEAPFAGADLLLVEIASDLHRISHSEPHLASLSLDVTALRRSLANIRNRVEILTGRDGDTIRTEGTL